VSDPADTKAVGSLPVLVAEAEAHERATVYSRPRRWMFWRQPPVIRRLEVLVLPLWVFPCGKTGEPTASAAIGVEAMDGAAFVLDPDLPPPSVKAPPLCLAPRLTSENAHKLAQQELQDTALRSRRLKSAALVGTELRQPFLIGYPFWIAYLKKGNRYDFLPIDAVSGSHAGLRMRKAVLFALRDLEKAS